MRNFLVLLVPAAWGLMWIFIRLLMAQRVASSEQRQEPVIEVTWRETARGGPAAEQGPLCQRHNLHLFLRLFGAERSCKHCAAVRREREAAERDSAVEEAERHISSG